MKIGDTVYIIGKYLPYTTEPYVIVSGKIECIKHRQFVVYDKGEWRFSRKHLGKCVFLTREAAEKALEDKRKEDDGK